MRQRKWIGALAAVLVLGVIVPAAEATTATQEGDEGETYVRHDERDWEDEGRWALGLGVGLVNVEDPRISDDVEVYWNLNLRYAIGGGRRGRSGARGPGTWRGYFEPELGYWESSAQGTPPSFRPSDPVGLVLRQQTGKTDLLLGCNIVGVMPWQAVDFFIGAGVGIHFIDVDQTVFTKTSDLGPISRQDVSISDEALGVNAHFGVDVGISRRASFFGVGRFDIIDDESNSTDIKAYVGIRFRTAGRRGRHWSPDDD